MKIKNLPKYFVVLLLVTGCGTISNLFTSGPDISIKREFDGNGIAVLNFTKMGPIPGEAGKLAADKLTDSFFLVAKYNVVDRAKVNEAQTNLEITSSESLSSDQIQKLGQKLKANYLVLGRVHCIASDDFLNTDSDKKLNISFRIISVVNQDVIGVVNYSCSYEDNLVEKLQTMLTHITSNLASIK